jgi:hypothetical protein
MQVVYLRARNHKPHRYTPGMAVDLTFAINCIACPFICMSSKIINYQSIAPFIAGSQ